MEHIIAVGSIFGQIVVSILVETQNLAEEQTSDKSPTCIWKAVSFLLKPFQKLSS